VPGEARTGLNRHDWLVISLMPVRGSRAQVCEGKVRTAGDGGSSLADGKRGIEASSTEASKTLKTACWRSTMFKLEGQKFQSGRMQTSFIRACAIIFHFPYDSASQALMQPTAHFVMLGMHDNA
jgi:hypothetical protein